MPFLQFAFYNSASDRSTTADREIAGAGQTRACPGSGNGSRRIANSSGGRAVLHHIGLE